jgi:hypothetical protein
MKALAPENKNKKETERHKCKIDKLEDERNRKGGK